MKDAQFRFLSVRHLPARLVQEQVAWLLNFEHSVSTEAMMKLTCQKQWANEERRFSLAL
jgi:hypothetical protein